MRKIPIWCPEKVTFKWYQFRMKRQHLLACENNLKKAFEVIDSLRGPEGVHIKEYPNLGAGRRMVVTIQ